VTPNGRRTRCREPNLIDCAPSFGGRMIRSFLVADAIIGADNAVMSTLGREDLELLLS